MSSLQMPKVDNSVLSRKDKIASDLESIIDPKNVLSHSDELRPYETDGLTAYRKMPMMVVLPETVEEVSKVLKDCLLLPRTLMNELLLNFLQHFLQ